MEILRTAAQLRHWSRQIRVQCAREALALKGHGFTRAENAPFPKETGALGAAEKLDSAGFVSGHDFSRAENAHKMNGALAPAEVIALVPTMGALHAGHASLIRAASASCAATAVSIFVNPTQFGPHEDFARYPRTFDADCALAQAAGATVVFAPSVEELYPHGPASTFVEVPSLSQRLDGQSRPGHFRGVATVVAKLLIAAEPDRAFFGQKDAAQVAVLRRMAADLRLATEIVVCPIVREPDGLALSSRNIYLSPAERAQALVLSRALRHVESLYAQGNRHAATLIAAARQIFAAEPEVRPDYIELVDWATLEPLQTAAPGALFAVAAYVGPTRLIDNTILP